MIKKAWPSSMRTLSGDHERFETTYFKVYPGYYFTGDGCRRDKDGYYWLIGGTHYLSVRSRVTSCFFLVFWDWRCFQMPKTLETQL